LPRFGTIYTRPMLSTCLYSVALRISLLSVLGLFIKGRYPFPGRADPVVKLCVRFPLFFTVKTPL